MPEKGDDFVQPENEKEEKKFVVIKRTENFWRNLFILHRICLEFKLKYNEKKNGARQQQWLLVIIKTGQSEMTWFDFVARFRICDAFIKTASQLRKGFPLDLELCKDVILGCDVHASNSMKNGFCCWRFFYKLQFAMMRSELISLDFLTFDPF